VNSSAPYNSVDNGLEMFTPTVLGSTLEHRVQQSVLPAELEFYQSYDWCLNPYLIVSEAMGHLREEVDKLVIMPNEWQVSEVKTNIFLLSCGLLNCVDGYLRGSAFQLPNRVAATVAGRGVNRFVETISDRPWSRRRIARWRKHWLSELNDFLLLIISRQSIDVKCLAESGCRLTSLLESTPLAQLQSSRLSPPSPFNHLDLTPSDVLRLGDSFARRFPERAQPILLVGLRTSGSYFAPLLRAFFESEGYQCVALLTIDPNKGAGRYEERELKHFAARGYLALIVDDPPHTNRSVFAALDIAHRAGFARVNVKVLAPTHSANPRWFDAFPDDIVITLPSAQWHKRELLNPKSAERRLGDYFHGPDFHRVTVIESRRADEINARLQSITSDERGVRLKRVFEVQLETPEGKKQTKYVLAKSVGWGWLSYRAFLTGHRLSGFVPPILGLRDGILYMEWILQPSAELGEPHREIIEASASYVAARVRHLNMKTGPEAGTSLKRHNNGSRLLEKTLSRAYGRILPEMLIRSRVGALVRQQRCPSQTLIDGNMHYSEWILGSHGPVKTDYEHHGMGKNALNITDAAYDLADTILHLELSLEEESKLIRQYITDCGDVTVEQRLFMHKLLAGLWAMSQTQDQLFGSPRGGDAQRDYHRRFMNAWNFLTIHTARHSGALCHSRGDLHWQAPLVVLDIDGVLDRRVFGFPCTTAAGVEALSLLHVHKFSVALNTARSASEVKDYCKAYSLAGGVAEHGGYLWDAVSQRERVLISAETARQLEVLRRHLRSISGVFLDERHQYSIRAFTYREKPLGMIQSLLSSARSSSVGDGALAPISTHIVNQLLVDLRLDRLAFHHTMIDTTIVAKEVDKGTGLVALRDWVLAPNAETIAVGDSEPDLAMFRVATRAFAPSNICCRRQAHLLGCRIVHHPYQRGLLEIVRKIIHPDDRRCALCIPDEMTFSDQDKLFMIVMRAADRSWATNLLQAMLRNGRLI
jgi:hydroxymethylpyrimidine pyrophosphatase-like HAD family hydrolase